MRMNKASLIPGQGTCNFRVRQENIQNKGIPQDNYRLPPNIASTFGLMILYYIIQHRKTQMINV